MLGAHGPAEPPSTASYDTDGRVLTRKTFTHGNGGTTVLAALNTTVTYARNRQDVVTARALTVGGSAFNHWYDYDARGLLRRVYASTGSSRPASPDAVYAYRPSGEVQNRQFVGGPSVPFAYTIREQLLRIGSVSSTTYPFSAEYGYHLNGILSSAQFYSAGSPAAHKRYRYATGTGSYDALNRLKSADFSTWDGAAWTSTLAYDLAGIGYDDAGNITALKRYRDNGTLVDDLGYAYAAGTNRLATLTDAAGASAETWDAEAGSFTYDANGNMTTAPAPYAVTAVTYDHQNLPLSLTSGGASTAYRYDENGQRIAKQVGTGSAEYYVLEGPLTLGVVTVNSSGAATAWHFNVLAGDRVVGRQPSVGNRRYYHTDLLGTTRAVVEGATVVESYDADPWGIALAGRTLAGPTKEGFTGKERDAESGLDYFGFRHYMAAVGRWTTVDPPADSFPEWSPYNYVEGNPVSYSDPFGLCPVCIVVGIGIVEGASAAYDIYQTYRAFKRSAAEGAESLQATVIGGIAPGPGHLWQRAARSLDALSAAARASDRAGLTAAGRALTKHATGQRAGSRLFPSLEGGVDEINAAAQNIVDDILTTPGTEFVPIPRGRFEGGFQVWDPSGRGMLYNASGGFVTFLERGGT